MDENKQKALAAALGQIEKQFGKGSIMRLGDNRAMDVETISTGSLSLDIALGAGGLPMGRIIEIYGPESSGKTTLTLELIAAFIFISLCLTISSSLKPVSRLIFPPNVKSSISLSKLTPLDGSQ